VSACVNVPIFGRVRFLVGDCFCEQDITGGLLKLLFKVSCFHVRDQIGGYRVCVLVGRNVFHLGGGVDQVRLYSPLGGDFTFQ